MSAEKTNVMRILDKSGIAYTTHQYPHDKEAEDGVTVARLLGQDCSRVYKTLVTKGAGGYFVFDIPVDKELDLKKAARSVGEKSVEMIHVSEINKVTGYIRGGCSPVGMKKQYTTVFHQECLSFPTIMVSAGKIGYQIEVVPGDIIGLIKAKTADLIKEHC